MNALAIRFGLVVSATVTLLVSAAAPAWSVVLNCGDAVGPGLVTADNDLTCPAVMGSPALTVASGGILDLRGHIVTCDPAGGRDGIVMATGTQLQNGTVSGCADGVVVGNNSSVTFINVASRDNVDRGFVTDTLASKITFQACSADNNGGSGFFLAGPGARITASSATNNNYGFQLVGSAEGAKISGSVAANNSSYGFDAGAPRAALSGNTAVANGGNGMSVGTGGKAKGNFAASNGGIGISGGDESTISKNSAHGNLIGIFVGAANGAKIVQNVCLNNTNGISVSGTGNQIKKNVVTGSPGSPYFDVGDYDCPTNTWTANVFATRYGTCEQ